MSETLQETLAKKASPEQTAKWARLEENRRNNARYRLLSAVFAAAENNELCNTLWDDKILQDVRTDIRTVVSDWMEELKIKDL